VIGDALRERAGVRVKSKIMPPPLSSPEVGEEGKRYGIIIKMKL